MSRKYKFSVPQGLYFISFATVEWMDVLTRPDYKDIIVDSLRYCQENKGLMLYEWTIMMNSMMTNIRSVGLLLFTLTGSVAPAQDRSQYTVKEQYDRYEKDYVETVRHPCTMSSTSPIALAEEIKGTSIQNAPLPLELV